LREGPKAAPSDEHFAAKSHKGKRREVAQEFAKKRAIDEALREAAMRGDAAGVRIALQNGADPLAQNGWGETALMLAVMCRHTECVKALLPVSDLDLKSTHGFCIAGENHEFEAKNILTGARLAPKCNFTAFAALALWL
jgi:hypothetical protein